MPGVQAQGWPGWEGLPSTSSTPQPTSPSGLTQALFLTINTIHISLQSNLRTSFLVTLPWVLVYVAAFFFIMDRTDEYLRLNTKLAPSTNASPEDDPLLRGAIPN